MASISAGHAIIYSRGGIVLMRPEEGDPSLMS